MNMFNFFILYNQSADLPVEYKHAHLFANCSSLIHHSGQTIKSKQGDEPFEAKTLLSEIQHSIYQN